MEIDFKLIFEQYFTILAISISADGYMDSFPKLLMEFRTPLFKVFPYGLIDDIASKKKFKLYCVLHSSSNKN